MLNGRILFDVTKAKKQNHKSGVLRVSDCLRRELQAVFGDAFVEVIWSERKGIFRPEAGSRGFELEKEDILITGELFCEFERPGVEAFLKSKACRTYAIFHDAIPLRFPEFTWPHSVQRHPSYMKMLSLFDGVFAVSQHSSIVLEEYWEWLGFEYSPSVKSLQLGADGLFEESTEPREGISDPMRLLMLGIVETRKGHDLAFDVCQKLWDEGYRFELNVVGRINPYFGKDLAKRMKQMEKQGYPLVAHGQAEDDALQGLFAASDLMLFPSRAEGCGLPVLESLWCGLPVLGSRLHSVRETSRFGGCQFFKTNDLEDFEEKLKRLISNQDALRDLKRSIRTAALPKWSDTARELVSIISPEHICNEYISS